MTVGLREVRGIIAILFMFLVCHAKELMATDFGAVEKDITAGALNAAAVTSCLRSCGRNDTCVINGDFYALGGIVHENSTGVTLRVDGALRGVADFDAWPKDDEKHYSHFIRVSNVRHFSIIGSGALDGGGKKWWNKYVLKPLPAERPKLVVVKNSTDIKVADVLMLDSPSWHLVLDDVARAEVARVNISVDRSAQRLLKTKMRQRRLATSGALNSTSSWMKGGLGGFPLQPEDLNTDGIDPSGRDIHIHDCVIDNDDDSIAVKPCSADKCEQSPCSQDMLIENMVLTGFGASIGSVPPHAPAPNCVRNITFRNLSMPGTGKGLYVKSNPSCNRDGAAAIIADITYEDVLITKPRWWAIWIGPQQQHEPQQQLGDKCALDYPINSHCPTQGCVNFRNITLRNIVIDSPLLSPGVVLGNASNPMTGVVFDNVTVKHPGLFPFLGKYRCENALGSARYSSPLPSCFV